MVEALDCGHGWWDLSRNSHPGTTFGSTRIECPFCGASGKFTLEWSAQRAEQSQHGGIHSGVYKCTECANLTFVIWRTTSSVGAGAHSFLVAPSPKSDKVEPSKDWPAMVGTAYVEAIKAIRSSSWNSAAAMARRAVQAATREKGATPGILHQEIKELGKLGLLTKDLMEWADHVRGLGNVGAHPDDLEGDVSEDDARDAVNFAQYFLEYVYTVPAEIARKRAKKVT